jgi:aspartate aminotransferase
MSFSDRVEKLESEGAYIVMARANQLTAKGKDIIHLEIGQPDFPTYSHIAKAGMDAISEGFTRYTSPAGMPDLREVIAKDAGERRGMKIDPSEVVVGPGGKPGLLFPTLALVEPGSVDEVIYPDPGFPTYVAMVDIAGGVHKPVPLSEEKDFSFNLEEFNQLVSDRTRLVVINTPANPTGGIMPISDLEKIAEAAQKHDFWVMSDEIYSRLTYDGLTAPSIATLPGMKERTIIVDGFSKTYSMTGWRLGYSIMPEPLAERISLLYTHSIGCTAAFTQIAGIEAITGPQDMVDDVVKEYQQRRDVMVEGLNNIPG